MQTLEEKLVEEFFDSRNFPSQHDFAVRGYIQGLRAEIKRLIGEAEKGSNNKSDKVIAKGD